MKRSVLAAGLLLALPACAAIWGFEDGTLGIDGEFPPADSSTPPDSSTPVRDAGVTDADVIDPNEVSDAAPPGCNERVLDQNSYFVDARTGEDTDACGSLNSPCRSLGSLLGQILPESPVRLHVYVGVGDYAESVVVPTALRGRSLTIDGRWFVRLDGAGRQWLPYCGSVPTRVQSTGPTIVEISGTEPVGDPDAGEDSDAGTATALALSNLQLESREAQPAESLYGLVARHAEVTLTDTRVVVARAGDGATGPVGAPGVQRGDSCTPNAALAQGEAGPPGSPGEMALAQPPGRFTATGYTPSAAPLGFPGDAGSPGGPPEPCPLGVAPTAGCGGTGGAPGGPGLPGGSAVGIYLWSSRATLVRVAVQTGGGGDGAPGGAGGGGGPGRAGRPGVGVCPNLGLIATTGGAGGPGGTGSPAPGGPSFCTVAAGGSAPTGAEAIACVAGPGGMGSGTAAAGISGPLYTESDGGTEPTP